MISKQNVESYLTVLVGPNKPLPIPNSLTSKIREVVVVNSDEGSDVFEITFDECQSTDDTSILDNTILKPFNRAKIMMTIGAVPHVLIDGVITHQQLNLSDDLSTATISGKDVSLMMDLEEKTESRTSIPQKALVVNMGNLSNVSDISFQTDPMQATGEMDGIAYGGILKVRGVVEVKGVGSCGGLYYVKKVTHRITEGSYKELFELRQSDKRL